MKMATEERLCLYDALNIFLHEHKGLMDKKVRTILQQLKRRLLSSLRKEGVLK